MTFPRIVLALDALAWAGFGLMLLVAPTTLTGLQIELTGPVALAEIRAFYGGLELGFAAFCAWALGAPSRVPVALMANALTLGGLGLARVGGILYDGASRGDMWGYAALELTGAAVSVVAARRAGSP